MGRDAKKGEKGYKKVGDKKQLKRKKLLCKK